MEPCEIGPATDGPCVFERHVPEFGRFWLRRLRIPQDMWVVHGWVCQPYARYWGLVGRSLEEVTAAYVEIARRADVFLGHCNDAPAFLCETYRPGEHAVGEHYPVRPHDRGMHVLTAPSERPLHDFTWAVFRTVMDFLFSDPEVGRVVVEPDIRNAKIHSLNRRAGFRYERAIVLPGKIGHLAFCERAQYHAALTVLPAHEPAHEPGSHLSAEAWQAASAGLVRKAIAEFAHERLLHPRRLSQDGAWAQYSLASDDGSAEYQFRARILQLDHWDIDAGSLSKTLRGQPAALDAPDFILECNARLGLAPDMLRVYLEEITCTLYARAFTHACERRSAADLVHADFQEIEASMNEGHPTFVANSGRVGFDAADYLRYAPEVGAPVRLIWLAGHRSRTEFSCAGDLDYARLMHEELGPDVLSSFEARLREQGLDPSDYLLLPVHPWQWFEKLAIVFAADLASRALVCLGPGPDTYQAQQSIRTFFNRSRPRRRYIKVALSVLNMGFMRGLSADYMRHTPAINDFIAALIAADDYLVSARFGILREVAGIGYRNPHFDGGLPTTSPYRKMLAALYRDSPVPRLRAGERCMTMAALLHRDASGRTLLPQLIQASGWDTGRWLRAYLDAYLAPVVHCFYRHDLVFMPHGENVILVLEDHVPIRVLLKDIAEEAAIMDEKRALPEDVQRLRVSVPEDIKLLSIFTDVFDCFFRYLAQVLVEQGDYPEHRFWQQVADCLRDYQRTHPELAARFARHDLFAHEFVRSCLNRLQLSNNQQMIDLADPSANLKFAGTLQNPIAAHSPASELHDELLPG